MDPIADAIAAALEAGSGPLRAYGYVPDNIAPPSAFVSFPELTYDADMSGDHVATYRVFVVVSRAHDRTAFGKLAPYLAPSGVKATLEADPTLGGVVSSLRVTAAAVSPIDIAGQDYLTGTFTVEVYFE